MLELSKLYYFSDINEMDFRILRNLGAEARRLLRVLNFQIKVSFFKDRPKWDILPFKGLKLGFWIFKVHLFLH